MVLQGIRPMSRQDFPQSLSSSPFAFQNSAVQTSGRRALSLQVLLAYGLIMAAVWTPESPMKLLWMSSAAACIVLFSLLGAYSTEEMGLKVPAATATLRVLAYGILMACAIPLISMLVGEHIAPLRHLPWHSAWQYSIWAMLQQFILQSFLYVRLESLFGSRISVALTAVLFAAVHIPSPVLTICTLIGGLFFCEMFRRYRSIVAVGIVHAMLGLTVAVSFSDTVLHHMRVGIGYLTTHS